jgi:hypothetical protein
MITFTCECGKRHQVKEELAGKRGKCSCGKELVIPQATLTKKISRPVVAGLSEPPSAANDTRSRTGPPAVHWTIIVCTAALVLIVGTLGVWSLTRATAPAVNGTQLEQVASAPPPESKEQDLIAKQNAMPVLKEGRVPRQHVVATRQRVADEQKALQLFARAGFEIDEIKGANLREVFEIQALVEKELAGSIVGLHEVARRLNEKGYNEPVAIWLYGLEDQPGITEIAAILGKESTQASDSVTIDGNQLSFVWYNYGWLAFAVRDGAVWGLRVDPPLFGSQSAD